VTNYLSKKLWNYFDLLPSGQQVTQWDSSNTSHFHVVYYTHKLFQQPQWENCIFHTIDSQSATGLVIPILDIKKYTSLWVEHKATKCYPIYWIHPFGHFPITHGFPQGAILTPLLFCIYLNDLPLAPSSCNLKSYVDDSKLFLSFPLTELDAAIEKLEQDLLSVAQWCCENHLLINPDKTKLLFIRTRQMLSKLPQNPSILFRDWEIKTYRVSQGLGSHTRSLFDLRPSYFQNCLFLLF